MKLIIDENIAFAEEAFSKFGAVELYQGRKITNKILKDADVLITRAVTNVNEQLLRDTGVKFVGTATIGWDHVDTDYLSRNNIFFTSAAGCNSDAVTEYVYAALFKIAAQNKISLPEKKIGIIGVGNIGSRVASIADKLGMRIYLNDPPLARETSSRRYLPLAELFECDILTLHIPLTMSGKDKTYHLLDSDNLRLIKENTILLNSSRGPVIDNRALIKVIKEKKIVTVLDVWENEPEVDIELLNLCRIGTPHIAGYSLEGKINGTKIIYNELCRFSGYDPGWIYKADEYLKEVHLKVEGTIEERINSAISQTYDIMRDDKELRNIKEIGDMKRAGYFDLLRKNYPLRKEFSNYKIMDVRDEYLKNILKSLRFAY